MIDDTSDTSRRREYTATAGQTLFDYPFKIFSDEDLQVYVNGDAQTLTSDYTVSGAGDDGGGTFTFLAALAAGDEVVVYTDTVIERTADYQQNGDWTSARLNDEFDRNVVIDQEQRHYLRRTLRGSILEDELNALPLVSSRASKYLYFDANGQPIAATGEPSDPLTVRAQVGTATSGQTEINTTYAYTPGVNHLSLYVNGERQVIDIDYTETDSDTVTLTTPMVEGDVYLIEIGEVRDVTLLRPVKRREDFVLTDGQTVVTLASNTYVPDNNEIEVYMNGALLRPAVHYTETNSTTITLTAAAQESDEIAVVIGQGFDPLNNELTAVFPQSDREVAAGVTPSDLTYPWGNVFRYGCVNDGTQVDTPSFSQALSAHPGEFHVPYTGTTYIIGKLTVPSNARLRIDPGVTLQDAGALVSTDPWINLTGSKISVESHGATFTMNSNYASTSSSRVGLYIAGTDVAVRGGTVTGCDMDGVFVDNPAQRVRLEGVTSTANRRDGFRIVAGRGVVLEDCFGSLNTGVDTQAGFNIYPDGVAGKYLENIKLVRCRSRSNAKAGFLVSLENWDASNRTIDILIDSPFSATDVTTAGSSTDRPASFVFRRARMTPDVVRGLVQVVRPLSLESDYAGLRVEDWDRYGPRLEIESARVVNPNQAQGTTPSFASGVVMACGTSYTTTPGNVWLRDPVVTDNDGNLNAYSVHPFYLESSAGNPWRDGEVRNPSSNSAAAVTINSGLTTIGSGFRVAYAVPPRVQLTTTPVTATYTNGTTYHNTGQAASRTVNLPDCGQEMVDSQWEYEFEVNAAQYIVVDPNTLQEIRPGSTGGGKYIRSNTIGSRLRIRAGADGYWHIINQVGTWAFEP